ncbi:hypothetical protein FRX31_027043 [Thalictrum thalictroides]|uniref:Uncharacterized protein n=1 Tax=Thalictrum thalictroides TaxID=46969 RepID=A0A7J6VFB3_THATH|nr:hypothetical protein FRX31_027043 [Thalictrum thalictroides]
MEVSGFGFTFDNENNLVVTTDKDAFDRYFEAHPEAKSVRGKRFPYYEAMSTLVGNEIAIGVGNNGGEDSPLERNNGQNDIGERILQPTEPSSADSESTHESPLCICTCCYCKGQRDMALKNT